MLAYRGEYRTLDDEFEEKLGDLPGKVIVITDSTKNAGELVKLSAKDARLTPSMICIAKADGQIDTSDPFVTQHMMISFKNDLKTFREAIKTVIFPSKVQLLDASIREPVTHM